LVLGVCNGFQVLVRMGMLPASAGDWQQEVALVQNDSGQFVDRWVTLDFDPASPCVWTRGLRRLDLPIRHGEGRMVAAGEVLDRIDRAALAPVRYVSSDAPHPTRPPNPNGSQRDIAGLCDSSGNVFGLMPHPEAFLHRQLHPLWRRDRELTGQSSDALQLFRNAVEHVRARR
jgi:phosphoribosylformylglycinamidine synthase